MRNNPHFETAMSWKEAETLVTFKPLKPSRTEGFTLQSIEIFVRDHKHRELPVGERSLEAHYDGFVLTLSRKGKEEARRQALEVPYGRFPVEAKIQGHDAHVYELGPEPEADDIDPRSPSVVVWHDGEMLLLIASDRLPSETLVRIAESVY
jgi:hypothetical protein